MLWLSDKGGHGRFRSDKHSFCRLNMDQSQEKCVTSIPAIATRIAPPFDACAQLFDSNQRQKN
jgi:hypothetical protein